MKDMPNEREVKVLGRILANDHALIIQDAHLAPAYEHLINLVRKGYLDFERNNYNLYTFEISDIVIDYETDLQFL